MTTHQGAGISNSEEARRTPETRQQRGPDNPSDRHQVLFVVST